jgi:hypothetical protein
MLVPRGVETEMYHPTERRDLFRKFDSLDGSPQSILDFANAHGRLVEEGTDPESIVGWHQEVRAMGRVLTAWDYLNGRCALTGTDLVRKLWPGTTSTDAVRVTGRRFRMTVAGLIETILNSPPAVIER